MRSEPSDRAEMVNQLLFGDTFTIIEQQEKWSLIRCHHDGYEGWVDNKQYRKLTNEDLKVIQHNWVVARDPDYAFIGMTGVRGATVTIGGRRPNGDVELLEGLVLRRSGRLADNMQKEAWGDKKPTILGTASRFLETPYLWGGRSTGGIDCSGFTQVVFRAYGIPLYRDAAQQATQGKEVQWKDRRPEDLCFFCNDEGRVIHVGIYCGENRILHSSGYVRVSIIDETGIYDGETKQYTHKLHSIRRIKKATLKGTPNYPKEPIL